MILANWGEELERITKSSILSKEKGNKDSRADLQDIFLRLKIVLTLGLS